MRLVVGGDSWNAQCWADASTVNNWRRIVSPTPEDPVLLQRGRGEPGVVRTESQSRDVVDVTPLLRADWLATPTTRIEPALRTKILWNWQIRHQHLLIARP